MIGSHNSATYLKEKSWWMTILRPWTRCQTKTLREQYNSGIRYFDFRIKVFGDTEFGYRTNICHNNVLYKESLFEALCEIDYDDVVKVRGMDIVFVTTAKTNEESFDLLNGLGIPFRK